MCGKNILGRIISAASAVMMMLIILILGRNELWLQYRGKVEKKALDMAQRTWTAK